MTRIIAGEAGGRRLRTPPGSVTRPTSDRVREALFSALESQLGSLAGTRFLDLYAGSGAVGLEAGSRGAVTVVLVERSPTTASLARSNARALGLAGITVLATSALSAASTAPTDAVDVAFLDPPYSTTAEDVREVLRALVASSWLGPEALVVVERSSRGEPWAWPNGIDALRSKKYGETTLWYGRVASERR
jgi:16S rRNA (guanine966-N2)-methyltransferase